MEVGKMSKKKTISISCMAVIICIIGLMTFWFAKKNRREIYTPQTFTISTWGNNKGEFAKPDTTPLEEGPTFLALDNKEYIYVLDAVNRKVIIFDDSGNFKKEIKLNIQYPLVTRESKIDLFVDGMGNIYVYRHGNPFLDIFDQNGSLIKRYIFVSKKNLPELVLEEYSKIEVPSKTTSLSQIIDGPIVQEIGYVAHLCKGRNQNIYLSTLIRKASEEEVLKGIKKSNETLQTMLIQISITALPELYKSELSDHYISCEELLTDKKLETSCIGEKITGKVINKKNGKVIMTFLLPLHAKLELGKYSVFVHLITEDKYGNYYMEVLERQFINGKESEWKEKKVIKKYDSQGKLITTIEIPNQYNNLDFKGGIWSNTGSYYAIYWNKLTTIKIIKWRP